MIFSSLHQPGMDRPHTPLARHILTIKMSDVGSTILLDDNDHTVVGVMPATFENVLAPAANIWAPLQYDPASTIGTRMGASPPHGGATSARR